MAQCFQESHINSVMYSLLRVVVSNEPHLNPPDSIARLTPQDTRCPFHLNGAGETRGECLRELMLALTAMNWVERERHGIMSHSLWSPAILLLSKSKGMAKNGT